MNSPYAKTELMEQLRQIQAAVTETVQGMSETQFQNGNDEAWSAAGYLKHLILSVKPAAKGIGLPAAKLKDMFGQSDRPSMSYTELAATYQKRLDEGVRAEDYDRVVPISFCLPEGTENEQAYLIETWNESNDRFLNALEQWSEADLDTYQMPHPAVGMITLREMVFFTLHHNTLHYHDIQRVGAAV